MRQRLLALVLLLLGLASGAAAAAPVTITFLHSNDVYEIAPVDGQGGLAELMTLLKQERAKAAHSITTFGGDLISPSVMSGLTKGAQMIDLYNRLGLVLAVPGNHEFDFGPDVLAERIKESRFAWLAANVAGPDGQPPLGLVPSRLFEVAGFKIGVFGLLTPTTKELSSPGPTITIAPMIERAQQAVAALRGQGAELIVALTHADLADDRALLQAVDGIDLLLGGHDHEPISIYQAGGLIAKAGSDAHYLLAVDLRLERITEDDKPALRVLPSWRYLSTAGVTPDGPIQALVEQYNEALDEDLLVPVGTAAVELDSRRDSVRTAESNFGNLVADAMRAAVGAEIGLMNGGGIRGDRVYLAGSTLTRKDILTELPFGNRTVLLALSGADLLAALEHGLSGLEGKAGRFLQVAGLRLTYDAARPAGQRVVEVTVAGQPLDLGRRYRVATNDYLYRGGDGFAVLAKGQPLIDPSGAVLVASSVMAALERQGKVSAAIEGRIVRQN